MNHVAIDLGSTSSQICMRSPEGTILLEKKVKTQELPQLLSTLPTSRLILETSSEAFLIADHAKAAGHEIRVVRSTLSKELGVGDRGIKTDRRDARKLSEVSTRIDLPTVHVPSMQRRLWRAILRSRELLIQTRSKSVCHVRGWLRTQLMTLPKGATETFPQRVRQLGSDENPLPAHIEAVLIMIDTLNAQVTASMKQITELAKRDEVCVRLMSIPGVGPISAMAFVAAIDNVSRFPNVHRVQSYLGLTPGEDSSSKRERRTGITKAGPSSVRRVLIQAAWAAKRYRPHDPMVKWATQIEERRGKHIAVVALARKISGVMFALWRDKTNYSPLEAAATATRS